MEPGLSESTTLEEEERVQQPHSNRPIQLTL